MQLKVLKIGENTTTQKLLQKLRSQNAKATKEDRRGKPAMFWVSGRLYSLVALQKPTVPFAKAI